jgi:hypothetical protein
MTVELRRTPAVSTFVARQLTGYIAASYKKTGELSRRQWIRVRAAREAVTDCSASAQPPLAPPSQRGEFCVAPLRKGKHSVPAPLQMGTTPENPLAEAVVSSPSRPRSCNRLVGERTTPSSSPFARGRILCRFTSQRETLRAVPLTKAERGNSAPSPLRRGTTGGHSFRHWNSPTNLIQFRRPPET